MWGRNGGFGRCGANMQHVFITSVPCARFETVPVEQTVNAIGSAPELSLLSTFGAGGFIHARICHSSISDISCAYL